MIRKTRTFNLRYSKAQSFISAGLIQPKIWCISPVQALQALKAQGYDVKKIKIIRRLVHQVCISYWDEKGGVCSGFFSYRIFERWQRQVEKLIYDCRGIKELQRLDKSIEYEFNHYPYPNEMRLAIANTYESVLSDLKALWSYAVDEYQRTKSTACAS